MGRVQQPMIIVIPMMGEGVRFSESGYSDYKSMVRVNSKHLIKLVIDPVLESFNSVYVICNEENAQQIRSIYDDSKVNIIILKNPTRGAADTIYQSLEYLPNNQKIVCLDCDTILHKSAIEKLYYDFSNAILTFIDVDKTGIYSYIKLNSDGSIFEIREKQPISTIASAGVYIFENVDILRQSCSNIILESGELYLSRVVNDAIKYENTFTTMDITNCFDCCGTPFQLKQYSISTKSTKTICFDIDGTLIYDLYTNPIPIEKNVKFCNQAYMNGHTIILHTARGMLSNNGDMDRIEALRPYIVETLSKLKILYHDLVLMKPYADLYIDDKAISSHKNLERETGIYLQEHHSPRQNNKITIDNNLVIKEGNIKGEAYYYSTVPTELKNLFPNTYEVNQHKIELQRINTPTYSTLLMSQKLTKLDIDNLIKSIQIIHNSNSDGKLIDLNWAYRQKVMDRFHNRKDLYNSLGINLDYFYDMVNVQFNNKYGRIHGDPVFTNIFLGSPYCKFIDVRGEWDDVLTNSGDLFYDYAKILQSLYGYDYALHNEPILEPYLESLRNYYLDSIKSIVDVNQLKIKTKLLYISMIPFHSEDVNRCLRFSKILQQI